MLASIHPLGERVRRNRWWLTAAAHVLASAGGGRRGRAGLRPQPGAPGAGERRCRHPWTALELPAPLPGRRGGRPAGDGGVARRPRRGRRSRDVADGGPPVTVLSRFGLT